MSRALLVLRHGKSAWPDGVGDRDRPLTKRGEREATAVGEVLAAQGLIPDRVVSSPALRALTTARLAIAGAGAGVGGWRAAPVVDERLYEGDARPVVAEHLPESSCLLVVGHEPELVELVASLTGAAVRLPTAGLVWIEVANDWSLGPAGQGAIMRAVLPPKVLARQRVTGDT